MSRIERIEGERWAVQTIQSMPGLQQLSGAKDALINVLKRGLEQKPADYAAGVDHWIKIVEAQP